jgi:hypothetical protein
MNQLQPFSPSTRSVAIQDSGIGCPDASVLSWEGAKAAIKEDETQRNRDADVATRPIAPEGKSKIPQLFSTRPPRKCSPRPPRERARGLERELKGTGATP